MQIYQLNHSFIVGDCLPLGIFVPHSRFAGVVNFINEQNQLAYITSKENQLASNAIFFREPGLSEVSSLTITDETIILDQCPFDRKSMEVYNSGLTFEGVDYKLFESRLLQIPLDFITLFPEKSLIFLLNPVNEKFFSSGFDHQFMINARESAEFIVSGEIIKGIRAIRGTGYGLTPSGDDFIAGLLLGIHFNSCRLDVDLSAIQAQICYSVLGGNLLTNSFILNAKNRNYFYPLKKVLLLLGGAANTSIEGSLKELFSVGATSGGDLFSGYIFAVKFNIGV